VTEVRDDRSAIEELRRLAAEAGLDVAGGSTRVRVLRHDGEWCGITFPEDRRPVRQFISGRIAVGEYPKGLWG